MRTTNSSQPKPGNYDEFGSSESGSFTQTPPRLGRAQGPDGGGSVGPATESAKNVVALAFAQKRSREGEALARALREQGYAVHGWALGAALVERVASARTELLMLDGCIDAGELESLRTALSAANAEPGIIVLCQNLEPIARARLLDAGADDVVPKPFDLRELIARVEAVRRRVRRSAQALHAGRITVLERDRLAYVDAARVPLTDREWSLLRVLVQRANCTVSRAEVVAAVWCTDASPASNVLDVHVAHLRRKLGSAGRCLRAVRGVGYRLEVQNTPSRELSTS